MKCFLLSALLSLCMSSLGAFAAQESPAAAPSKQKAPGPLLHRITDVIVSAAGTSLAIKTSNGKEMTFGMDNKTTRPAELKTCDRIRV
ncbi:MAG: hypothetical protein LAP85_11855 [Acidobacteriia bacterium]|nr:hypothetical protein [Terriglobia bacterium]